TSSTTPCSRRASAPATSSGGRGSSPPGSRCGPSTSGSTAPGAPRSRDERPRAPLGHGSAGRGAAPARAGSVGAGQAEHVLAHVGEHEVLADGRGLVEPRLPELPLYVVFLGVAVAAVAVDAGVSGLPRRLRRQVLGDVGLGPAGLARVEERGGLVAHQLRRL